MAKSRPWQRRTRPQPTAFVLGQRRVSIGCGCCHPISTALNKETRQGDCHLLYRPGHYPSRMTRSTKVPQRHGWTPGSEVPWETLTKQSTGTWDQPRDAQSGALPRQPTGTHVFDARHTPGQPVVPPSFLPRTVSVFLSIFLSHKNEALLLFLMIKTSTADVEDTSRTDKYKEKSKNHRKSHALRFALWSL